jgi:hypothetical protein
MHSDTKCSGVCMLFRCTKMPSDALRLSASDCPDATDGPNRCENREIRKIRCKQMLFDTFNGTLHVSVATSAMQVDACRCAQLASRKFDAFRYSAPMRTDELLPNLLASEPNFPMQLDALEPRRSASRKFDAFRYFAPMPTDEPLTASIRI